MEFRAQKIFYVFVSESKDPRKKDLPPRPSGQRPEPDRRGTGAFGQQFPFGGGNFQFSFGIGGFPFGFMGTFANFGTEQPPPVSLLSFFTNDKKWPKVAEISERFPKNEIFRMPHN